MDPDRIMWVIDIQHGEKRALRLLNQETADLARFLAHHLEADVPIDGSVDLDTINRIILEKEGRS